MKRYLPKFLYSVSTPSLICLALLLGSADALRAQTPRAIFNFDNSSHGCCPAWPHILAQGRDGSVYGTALGGTIADGIVFRFVPPVPPATTTNLFVVFNFDGSAGISPRSGLTLGTDGGTSISSATFYGTNHFGGLTSSSVGTLFKITPGHPPVTLHDFQNTGDGGRPWAPPVQGADGNYYGTTEFQTAYKVTPAGSPMSMEESRRLQLRFQRELKRPSNLS